MRRTGLSPLKQKILLLLLGGVAFGYSYTPQKQWRLIKSIAKEWKSINERQMRMEINQLYRSKLIEKKENPDGSITLVLTDKGKMKTLTYHFEKMKIEEQEWDGWWRLVIFDVPERIRKGRDALREKLKQLGFYELQKSAFVFPYECRNEIDFLTEFFNLRRYVRFCILANIDNDLHLRKVFNLPNKNYKMR